MPVERHERCGDQDNDTIRQLQADLATARAEAAVLRDRVTDLTRMVMAEAEPAVQQAIRDGQPGRHRRPPGTRWLRAVPAIAVLAARPARHKLLAGLAASAAALVVVAAPAMNLAPWISGTPSPSHGAAVKAYTPPPAGGGGGVAVPPPRSSPPGTSLPPSPAPAGTPEATPTGTPSPEATATDTASPSPDPTATATDTPDPDPDPSATATAAACPPPGKHKG